jgi:serine/threonine protein kinase
MDMAWLAAQFPDLSTFQMLAPSGQKQVFSAVHKTEGPVVFKVFKPGSNKERIKREIDSPLKVKSARVPKGAEIGTTKSPTGDIIWLREQKIDGDSLKDVLKARGTLDAATAIRVGLHVLEVLADAEKAEVVHRDIKPGNIIIAPDGTAWVIDFGLARHRDMESVTASDAALAPHTPGYAPVEQFDNRKADIDGRADLFAIGVTLYECVEGVNPFVKGTKGPHEARERVRTVKLPRIATKGVPGQFIYLVEAMTRTKAEHRPARAADAFAWIKEIAADQKIAYAPPRSMTKLPVFFSTRCTCGPNPTSQST